MKQQLLLLEDVDSLGKKGEIVTAKPGYMRNYLLPRGYAVVATANMLKKQVKLREEREKQAVIDLKEAEALKKSIESLDLEIKVKVDPEGHMYGSVSAGDIFHLFEEKNLPVEKKYILVTKPIRETGKHMIDLRLKEGVMAQCKLVILPEGVEMTGLEDVIKPIEEEKPSKEESTSPSSSDDDDESVKEEE